jgi:hypothetical protein
MWMEVPRRGQSLYTKLTWNVGEGPMKRIGLHMRLTCSLGRGLERTEPMQRLTWNVGGGPLERTEHSSR